MVMVIRFCHGYVKMAIGMAAALWLGIPGGTSAAEVRYRGVNLSGLEFGNATGEFGTAYTVPDEGQFAYWGETVGATIVRIPFPWERLEPVPGGGFDEAYLALLQQAVGAARAHHMIVILDMHNYAAFGGRHLKDGNIPAQLFADTWRRLAEQVGDREGVWLGLMNEPHGIAPVKWAAYSQQAVTALREGGVTNRLLISGSAWSGAHSWRSSGNAAAFEGFDDPLNDFAFDVHQYLDANHSGTSGEAVSGAGGKVLRDITDWARSEGVSLFLGETGAASPQIEGQEHALEELSTMLDFMNDNDDVWLGWTLWGAGPWWPESYHFEINPGPDGAHDPVIEKLLEYFQ